MKVDTTSQVPVEAIGRPRLFRLGSLRSDAMAGLAVALMAVPQGMAYALIAGLPIRVGLYAGIVPPILAAIFGSSRYLVTGPTNAIALLTFSIILPLLKASGMDADKVMPAVGLLALISGSMLVLGGFLKLGQIIRYVAQSAMTGFLAGAGILIILGQVRSALGINKEQLAPVPWPHVVHVRSWGEVHIPQLPEQIEMLSQTLASLGATNWHALAVFAVSFFLLWAILRYNRKLPAVPVVLVVVTLAAWLMGWDHGTVRLIRDRGIIPMTLPPWSGDSVLGFVREPKEWSMFFTGGAALALLAMTEAITIAKGLAARSGDHINVNREMIGQGMGQIGAALTGGMVPAGSQTRSALNMISGAQTRFAQLASGLWMALIVIVLARPAGMIPIAALSAIVIYSATGLINVQEMRRTLSGTRSDTLVLVATIASTLLLRLDEAIYVGAALSVLTALRHTSRLVISEMVMRADGRLYESRPDDQTGRSSVVVLQLEGSLYFGAADELETYLRQLAIRGPRVIILRLKRAHHLDMTVAERLAQLATDLRQLDVSLILCGLRPDVAGLLERTGLAEAIGPRNLFLTDHNIFGSVRRAIERGRELVGDRNGRPVLRSEAPQMVRPAEAYVEDYVI